MLLILILSLFTTLSQASIESDYKILLKEQILSHERFNKSEFYKNLLDFNRFKKPILELLHKKYQKNFTKNEIMQFSKKFNDYQGPEIRRKPTNEGFPVFHSFHGHWRGNWNESNKVTIYDHDWLIPIKTSSSIIEQKVIIGKWDSNKQKRIKEVAAINSFNPKNGLILGAVGLNHLKTGTSAYHLGIYVDASTLIWVARFGNNKLTPYYSIYYEKIQNQNYLIKGIGFYFNRKNGSIEKDQWKMGNYKKI